METLSALLALCEENSPVTGEFLSQRPVTRSFDTFFDLSLNTRWSERSWGWWFETPSRPIWRHCNGSPGGQWLECNITHQLHERTSSGWRTPPQFRPWTSGRRFQVRCRTSRTPQDWCRGLSSPRRRSPWQPSCNHRQGDRWAPPQQYTPSGL